MARKTIIFNGKEYVPDKSGNLYNAETKKYLIYRPYPLLVDQVNASYVEPDNKQEYTSKELKNKFGTDNTDIINAGKELEEQVSKKIEEESEKDYNTGMFAFNKPEQQNLKLYSESLKETEDDPYGVKSMLTEDLEQTEYDFTEESLNNPERKAVEEELVKRYEEEGDKVKYSQSFHLESPVNDIDEAQDYLSSDDMTQFVPEELKGVISKAEWVLDDEESGNINIETTRQLTQYEQAILSDWISGQNSDGLGEGFEQQDFSGGYYDPDSGEGPYTYNQVVDIVSRNYDNMDFEDYREYLDQEDIRNGLENYLRDGYYDQSFEDFMIDRASEISDEADLDALREEFENTPEDFLHDRYYSEYEDWLDSEEESFLDSGYAEEYISQNAIDSAKDEAAKEDSRYNENLWEDSMSSIRSDRPGFRSEFIKEEESNEDVISNKEFDQASQIDDDLERAILMQVSDDVGKTLNDDDIRFRAENYIRHNYNGNATDEEIYEKLKNEYKNRGWYQESNEDIISNDEENSSAYKEGDKVMFHGYETSILQVKNDPRWGPDYLIRGEEGNIWTDGSHFDRVESQGSDNSSRSTETANYNSYSADEQEILDRYTKDYGWDDNDGLKNLKHQIDSMKYQNESVNQTARRLVQGGDFLIYNGDMDEYLKERNIPHNEDNTFDVYTKVMADKIEKLYNSNDKLSINDANGFGDDVYGTTNRTIDKLKSADKYSSIDIQGPGNYHISKYDDGEIQISSSHPYDLSDYSFAKWSNMNNAFSIYDDRGKLVTVVKTIEEAVEEMKKIDKKIPSRIDRT